VSGIKIELLGDVRRLTSDGVASCSAVPAHVSHRRCMRDSERGQERTSHARPFGTQPSRREAVEALLVLGIHVDEPGRDAGERDVALHRHAGFVQAERMQRDVRRLKGSSELRRHERSDVTSRGMCYENRQRFA